MNGYPKINNDNASPVILLIDNYFISYDLLRLVLNDYIVEHALTGETAIEMSKHKHYDMFIIDLPPEWMNTGFNIISVIKNLPGNEAVPVIATSTALSECNFNLIKKKGISFFISKPYVVKELLTTVNHLLNKS
jgi:CheY-like chemotaxis protein